MGNEETKMRRDLFHYFQGSPEEVYNAYLSALKNEPFKKNPDETQNKMLVFGLGMSFKFNMNGGSVHIYFAPKDSGTAVKVHYSIAQLFGARYGAYDELLIENVEKLLGYKAEPISDLPKDYFENK